MATRQTPDDYKLSRAAMRERDGSRRINASAPQSARDFTPSGRLRYHMGQNPKLGETGASAMVAQDFRDMISGRMRGSLSEGFAGGAQPTVTAAPNPIQRNQPQRNSEGWIPNSTFEPATLNAPTMGGLSFDLNAPSLLPASTLASYMPSNTTAYTPSWLRRKAAPYAGAVLASANRWLT